MSGTETPGGDREGMVTVRGHDQAHLGCMGTETWKWLLDHPEMDAPALDRLVARNQQLQEALTRLVIYADNAEQKMRREYRAAGETYADEDWTKNEMESWAEGEALQDVLAEARAALASVRARTPTEGCEVCGSADGTADYRGWHDEGSPMRTCASCGGPDVRARSEP